MKGGGIEQEREGVVHGTCAMYAFSRATFSSVASADSRKSWSRSCLRAPRTTAHVEGDALAA